MSVPCIGWEGDEACPDWGQFHACTREDGHTGRHICSCGEVRKSNRALPANVPVIKCNTYEGYRKHKRNGEDACEPCMEAMRETRRDQDAERRMRVGGVDKLVTTVGQRSEPGSAVNAPGSGQRCKGAST